MQGDSGGPLLCPDIDPDQFDPSSSTLNNSVVCGIVSFGDSKAGCANANGKRSPYPPVYTNIGYYKKWIEEAIGKYKLSTSIFRSRAYICLSLSSSSYRS